MKAVFWSFFGVRKRKDYEHDAANLNPVHVIVAAADRRWRCSSASCCWWCSSVVAK